VKRLVLVRHGTAVARDATRDFHRRLRKKGRKESAYMALRVEGILGCPDRIVTSPADRALETARIFAEGLGYPRRRIVEDDRLYGGLTPDEFLGIVQELDGGDHTVMVFGHDPSFSEFAAAMCPAFEGLIPKCGVVDMQTSRRLWRRLRMGDASKWAAYYPESPSDRRAREQATAEHIDELVRRQVMDAMERAGVTPGSAMTRVLTRSARKLASELAPLAVPVAPDAEAEGGDGK
jgi:phosphohistidine phosphatase